ncbi:MAG: 23S rRNA pseudouridine synthase [Microgenomates group bacterium Gr01-1014_5]|nr:MAG: 23S rRNA pseudouridine synthase [Microgenomates group bacterium Gr01-1014_5]
MTPNILFEDSVVLVVDKPAGLVVNRAESVKEPTLQDWVINNFQFSIFNFQDGITEFEKRSGIVHRIDKETSGVLLVAKTPEAFVELQRQFKEREIEKTYIALVHGKFEREQGVINASVGRLPWNRERFGILPGGREAETRYKVVKNYDKVASSAYELRIKNNGRDKAHNSLFKIHDSYSLVEFYPKTGRTHQIRVHAKYLHHALVSDTFYAGRKTSRRDREWCPRLFLHAAKISFTHPETKERVVIESLLPGDLQSALSHLGGVNP